VLQQKKLSEIESQNSKRLKVDTPAQIEKPENADFVAPDKIISEALPVGSAEKAEEEAAV